MKYSLDGVNTGDYFLRLRQISFLSGFVPVPSGAVDEIKECLRLIKNMAYVLLCLSLISRSKLEIPL